MTNFIDELADDLMNGHFKISRNWAESLAIATLSIGVGSKKRTLTGTGPIPLNVWVLCIAGSGSGKNTPYDYVVEPIIVGLGRELKKDLLLPSESSSKQGLIGVLQDAEDKDDCAEGLFFFREMTRVFKDVEKAGYQKSDMEMFSEFYDGRRIRRVTIKRGKEYIDSTYITVIGTTTPYVYTVMSLAWFLQGTGNRFLPEFIDSMKPVKETPDYAAPGIKWEEENQEMIKKYVGWLVQLRASQIEHLEIATDDAIEYMLDFKLKVETDIYEMEKNNLNDSRILPIEEEIQ